MTAEIEESGLRRWAQRAWEVGRKSLAALRRALRRVFTVAAEASARHREHMESDRVYARRFERIVKVIIEATGSLGVPAAVKNALNTTLFIYVSLYGPGANTRGRFA